MPEFPKSENFVKGNFYPVFWSPLYFESKDSCGTLIHTKNPLFYKYFPTEPYAGMEWKDFLEHAYAYQWKDHETFDPLIELVPNFANINRNAIVLEGNVSNGKLLIVFSNLRRHKAHSLAIEAFYEACLAYISSDDFMPKSIIKMETLTDMLQ